jgi:hypothetical protein
MHLIEGTLLTPISGAKVTYGIAYMFAYDQFSQGTHGQIPYATLATSPLHQPSGKIQERYRQRGRVDGRWQPLRVGNPIWGSEIS